MDTFVQMEEGNFNDGLLPPLRELFLEIQVNKLIQEYLFSSNADEMRTSLRDESSDYEENKARDHFYATDMAPRSACNAPCVKSTEALDYHQKQGPHDPYDMQTSQASIALHSITCIEENEINGKGQTVIGKSQRAVNTAHEASFAALSAENEWELTHKTAHLNRVDTFPCTRKVQLQESMPSKANTDVKVSFKKPPRPPKVPKSELSSSLTRCCSDNGAYLQSSRRAKLERKRKTAATSSVDTSMWALLFTFCFAIIMIAQGFWSQNGQNFSTYGSDASTPMETFMRASSKVLPAEVSLAGGAERHASMDGVLPESYVMRKVQSQHLSDMKHLELNNFPKS